MRRLKETLYDSVLERMKRNDREHTFGIQQRTGRFQSFAKLCEFLIHLNAYRLEDTCRRVLS